MDFKKLIYQKPNLFSNTNSNAACYNGSLASANQHLAWLYDCCIPGGANTAEHTYDSIAAMYASLGYSVCLDGSSDSGTRVVEDNGCSTGAIQGLQSTCESGNNPS